MMKRFLILILLLSAKASFSQYKIYFTGGTSVYGKILTIDADKIKFINLSNPAQPTFVRSLNYVQCAFNPTGDYVVFDPAKPLGEDEKRAFLSPIALPRPYDILVDPKGAVISVKLFEENATELAGYNNKGQEVHYLKSNFLFLIRHGGTHQFFSSVDQALPFLGPGKQVINDLLVQPDATAGIVKPPSLHLTKPGEDEYIAPDMALFGTKALQKVTDFTGYLQTISSVNSDRAAAVKSIDQACGLFLEDGAQSRVEVSNIAAAKKYLIHDYLNRLMIKAGQYDKVNIEFAGINYASKFKKGPDGNYYGSVTFVQKFQGFVDGNLVYGDQTTRNVTIVLKHYEKEVNGQSVSGWDVFLDDIGITETKKI
jgi:hypothetical protein